MSLIKGVFMYAHVQQTKQALSKFKSKVLFYHRYLVTTVTCTY